MFVGKLGISVYISDHKCRRTKVAGCSPSIWCYILFILFYHIGSIENIPQKLISQHISHHLTDCFSVWICLHPVCWCPKSDSSHPLKNCHLPFQEVEVLMASTALFLHHMQLHFPTCVLTTVTMLGAKQLSPTALEDTSSSADCFAFSTLYILYNNKNQIWQ